ncbi:hypothetical protein [Allocoleopsis sp.]|uniref:hypothetical protein n=1 Tax=Allocoleopsis sp. TaxID=3088169 RepID=UPI002FCEEB43
MIPPASIRQKWSLLAIAALFPVTLMGVSLQEQTAQAQQQSSANKSVALPDGVYLYGNSPDPNQLARHYVVFERHKGGVVGAFYSPQSEFTCFAGGMQGTRLEVEALVPEQPKPKEVRAQLANLYPLQRVSANDRRMLSVCKQETITLATRP